MSLYLLRKRARKCGQLLRSVPGGGWCLLDAGTGAVVAGPLDLERIEAQIWTKETAVSAANTGGGEVEPVTNKTNSVPILEDSKGDRQECLAKFSRI